MTRLVIARRVEWWRTQRCDKLPDIFCCLHFDRHRIVFPVVHSPSCRPPHSAISRPFCLCVCGVLSHSLWAITHIYNSLAALCRHCKHLQNRARSNGKRHRHRSARSLPAPCVGVRYIYFFFLLFSFTPSVSTSPSPSSPPPSSPVPLRAPSNAPKTHTNVYTIYANAMHQEITYFIWVCITYILIEIQVKNSIGICRNGIRKDVLIYEEEFTFQYKCKSTKLFINSRTSLFFCIYIFALCVSLVSSFLVQQQLAGNNGLCISRSLVPYNTLISYIMCFVL